MTKKTRRILFWASTLIFIMITTPVILYSLGYRFSRESWKIVRSGGLTITSTPSTGTKIFIDGKLYKETTLLSRKLLAQGLVPRVYHIKIEKSGYVTWEKALEVKPERVTDVHALLVRDNPSATIALKGNYTSLSFADISETIILLKDDEDNEFFYSTQEKRLIPKPPITGAIVPSLSLNAEKLIKEKKIEKFDYDQSTERIIWWDDEHTLEIAWLRGEEFMPLYTEVPQIPIFKSPDTIRQASFYPGQEAVLVASLNEVLAVELDGRGWRNSYPFYKGKQPNLLVSRRENKAYILDDSNLIAADLF